MATLTVTLTGTGTSTGVPIVGCDCPVCRSGDPRDRRLRSSALVRWPGHSVVIDTGPEFRLQILAAGVERLDAALYTHAHIDHIGGLDDIRPYCFRQRQAMPLYGSDATMAQIRRQFRYIWEAPQVGGGLPRVDCRTVDGPFALGGVRFTPVPLMHGALPIFGYRFGDAAYLTDLSALPDASRPLVAGLETLVIGAVQRRPHSTHLTFEQAARLAADLGARRAIFTHIGHDLAHAELARLCPPGVEPGHDGLTFTVRVDEPAVPSKDTP